MEGKTTMRFVGFFRKTREPARDSSAFWFKLFSQSKGQVPADRFHPKLGSIPARDYFNRKTLQNPNCSFRRVDFGHQRSKGLAGMYSLMWDSDLCWWQCFFDDIGPRYVMVYNYHIYTSYNPIYVYIYIHIYIYQSKPRFEKRSFRATQSPSPLAPKWVLRPWRRVVMPSDPSHRWCRWRRHVGVWASFRIHAEATETDRATRRWIFCCSKTLLAGWWFGTFFIFPYIGNNDPNWLIFFIGVETTNQLVIWEFWGLDWLD